MYPAETRLYYAILTGTFVLLSLVALLVITILYYHKRKRALRKATVLAELNTLEKERARIAADLHDDLGTSLAAIKMKLQGLQVTGENDKEVVHQSENYIDEAVLKLKRVSFNMMPLVLERKGLKQALEELVNTMQDATGMQIAFSYDCRALPKEETVHIYRIVQEALTNIIKHSGAARASVELNTVKNRLHIIITDNGKGFNKKNVTTMTGRGLQNIWARADVLNARLYLSTEKDRGVTWHLQIPYDI